MTDAECAWLAGVFDGEGSIVARKRQQDGDCRNIAISIVNTSKPLMEQVLAFTETGWLQGRQPKNPNHLYQWTWTVHGATAIELIRRMRPWLTAKAERADAALEGRSFPRLPRWEKVYGDRPDPVAEAVQSE
ncbi:LAGLIDADG family homing endonuclease [Streptomyces sp. NPDC020801]|uniref:LAGLIDADG family homing endonuclease n=1 Tax=Streptomyces sp. NPDC020801 TaxID=3365093 RepID=UPI00379CDA69